MRQHQRDVPGWGCTLCGRPWPCAGARVQLATEYAGAPVSLGTYMAGQLDLAIADMPHAQPHELWRRFLSWTHP
ncbi:hypothetical protein GCM10022251_19730 [Phytohabitans flavus]|uniref:Flavin reductase n=1 Tax=Phytohabitans flavus TaxID=1076124 RepID=A0A6F8XZJ8_9ACTN|nr:hypothetical protein [Phytohabitans flavus]BCB79148.1 hypothetical protein Pflav_055580 [Phytohabitans flavus]